MAITMYQASAPTFLRMLKNLSGLLDKAAAHCAARKIDESVLVSARLYPDMLPLSFQVQTACDLAKRSMGRLAGIDPPAFEDDEKTLAELVERIDKTRDFIRSVDEAAINGAEDKTITLEFPGMKLNFTGQDYLLNFVLPNVYFHITTAHGILRHNGVEIGKMDYLGAPKTD